MLQNAYISKCQTILDELTKCFADEVGKDSRIRSVIDVDAAMNQKGNVTLSKVSSSRDGYIRPEHPAALLQLEAV